MNSTWNLIGIRMSNINYIYLASKCVKAILKDTKPPSKSLFELISRSIISIQDICSIITYPNALQEKVN